MICDNCGTTFQARAGAITCSTRCRVARHRRVVKFAPKRMTDAARWVRHIDKRPVTPTGGVASSTASRSWSTFAEAIASDVGQGPGFVLNGDGIVCVDLDGCLEDGKPTAWAQRILDLFPNAAIEVSLSGRGLHIWGTGPNVSKVFDVDGKRVEVYADKRYIAVTGNWMRRGDLVDLSDGLLDLGVA